MKRVIEGYVVNRVWTCVGYLMLDIVRGRVSGRVRDRAAKLVWARVSDRVAGLVWNRVSDRVGDRMLNRVRERMGDTWGTHGEYEVES